MTAYAVVVMVIELVKVEFFSFNLNFEYILIRVITNI